MVITRSLEKACTGPFRTLSFFALWGSETEPAELELADPGFGIEAAEPANRNRTESNRTEISWDWAYDGLESEVAQTD